MEQERIWLLLGRKVSGEATMAELRELEELLQEFPELRYKFSVLSSWQVPAKGQEWEERTEKALNRHLEKMGAADQVFATADALPVAGRRGKTGTVAILSLLVLVLGGYCVYLLSGEKAPVKNTETAEIQTRNGSRSKAVLPDGSEVWLNGGSRLTYHPGMNNMGTREVFLSGEAFFIVARNATKPFILHSNRMTVKVLGTSFNVRSYPDDKTAETSLLTGAVEVAVNNDPSRSVRLQPSQKIIIHSMEDGHKIPGSDYSVREIKAKEEGLVGETAWCDNFLVFDNESFEEIALKMERWYGIKIHLTDKKLKAYRFTGTFKNESYAEILEALKVTTSFHCRIERNEVFINL